MKAPKCKAHNVCYCHCLWTPGQRVAAGLSAMPFAMDSAPVALDALSDEDREMLEAAIKSARPVSKPARRSASTQDRQLRDALGRPVEHEFLTFNSQQIVSEPTKWKPYKYTQE